MSPWFSDIELVKLREGLVLNWYKDSLGKWTGGYGHLRKAGEENIKIDQKVADAWLKSDIKEARDAASSQMDQLPFETQHLFDVLVSVNFQLGIAWYKKFPKTWNLLKEGLYDKAAIEVQNSLWYKQTPVRVKDFQVALREAQCLFDLYKRHVSP